MAPVSQELEPPTNPGRFIILGVGQPTTRKVIVDDDQLLEVAAINAYLLNSEIETVQQRTRPVSPLNKMRYGNLPGDGNHLTLSMAERNALLKVSPSFGRLIIPLFGAQEFIRGLQRYCLWIDDDDLDLARQNKAVRQRIDRVRRTRVNSRDASYNALAERSHQFRDRNIARNLTILAPTVSSETREYLPTLALPGNIGTTNQAYALYDAPLWNLALIASKLHLAWIATVCGKLETRYRYSNTLGWNTFPVPTLTEQNKTDLTRCAEDILLTREAYFPATIAKMYDPKRMDRDFPDLRHAHERNDEVLERIYIGRRFKNDTERLEKLFDMYAQMTAAESRRSDSSKRKATHA